MEQQTPKFRLRLNFFDSIVLLLALLAGAFLLWRAVAPHQAENVAIPQTQQVRYTIRLTRALPILEELVQPGQSITDSARNNALGTVVEVQCEPGTYFTLSEREHAWINAPVPDRINVNMTVEASATGDDSQLLINGSYALRVGDKIDGRGPGYIGRGVVIAMERCGGMDQLKKSSPNTAGSSA